LAKSRRFNDVSLPAKVIAIRGDVGRSDGPLKDQKVAKSPGFKQGLGLSDSTSGSQRLYVWGRCFFGPNLAAFFDELRNAQTFEELSLSGCHRWSNCGRELVDGYIGGDVTTSGSIKRMPTALLPNEGS
jgi:hypothetical protein